jgi:hypothetical protein
VDPNPPPLLARSRDLRRVAIPHGNSKSDRLRYSNTRLRAAADFSLRSASGRELGGASRHRDRALVNSSFQSRQGGGASLAAKKAARS